MISSREFFDNHFRDAPYKYLNLLKKFMRCIVSLFFLLITLNNEDYEKVHLHSM